MTFSLLSYNILVFSSKMSQEFDSITSEIFYYIAFKKLNIKHVLYSRKLIFKLLFWNLNFLKLFTDWNKIKILYFVNTDDSVNLLLLNKSISLQVNEIKKSILRKCFR